MNGRFTCFLAAAILLAAGVAPTEAQVSGEESDNTSLPGNLSDVRVRSRGERSEPGQPENQPPFANASPLADGITIRASLEKSVDARKNHAGDEVLARTTENVNSKRQIVIPKGSKLVGHVTEVRAKAKDESQSVLGIRFDRAVLKDGHEIPLAVSIQALAAADANADANVEDMGSSHLMANANENGAPPLPVEGAPSQFNGKDEISGADTNSTARPVDASGNPRQAENLDPVGASSGELISSTHGVFGIKGLALSPVANSARESLIVSPSRNVHLDSGTRMILRVLGK
jgi:hypothetical protein